MPGELVPRRYSSGQLQRAVNGALSEVEAHKVVTEAIIKAKSQVGEYAASEATYLMAIAKIVATNNPAAAGVVGSIIGTTVAGIARTNAEFGASL
jgi:hypothetical protein